MTTTEFIGVLRDIAIITLVLVLLMATVMVILLIRKVSSALDSARATARQAVERSAFAYNAGQVLSFIVGLKKRKGGK